MTHVVLLSGTALSARNGSSKAEQQLARALARTFDVTLLTRDEHAHDGEPYTHHIYRRPSTKDWRVALLGERVADVLRRIHAERPIALVHAFAISPCADYALRFGAPFVVTHHNMELLPSSWLAARAARRALAGASAAIALNRAQGQALTALGARRVEVIHNGVGGERPAPSAGLLGTPAPSAGPTPAPSAGLLGPPVPDRFALFAGRLEAEKGIHLLLDAYADLPPADRRPLVIAGDGRDREAVHARARALGATVLPWLAHEVLLETLGHAALLVAPSFAEASPLLPLEAFARGVPVAIHDLPQLADDLRDEGGAPRALAIAVGDRETWSRALRRDAAIGDDAMLARARAAAEARAWPRVADAYGRVYTRVLDARSAP